MAQPEFIERRRVDATGAITGLEADKEREVLLVRLPDFATLQRQAEEEAERLARDLDLDPARARSLVHDAAEGAKQAAERAAEAWQRLSAARMVAQESAEEKEALRDVAVAAKQGGSDWGPTPATHAP